MRFLSFFTACLVAACTSSSSDDLTSGVDANDQVDATSQAGGPDGRSAAPDAATPAGSVELIAPTLDYDFAQNIYTIRFRIKNNTAWQVRAVSLVRVTGNSWTNQWPEITSVDCPESTPAYQWDLAPGELSEELAVVFGSSVTNLVTVIDMTCGSMSVLKSDPFGFDPISPFTLHIEGILETGSGYTLEVNLS